MKVVLLTVMICNAFSLLLFTLSKEYLVLFMSRFLTGFFQVFISIYYPVWADCFGKDEKQKTTWMSFLLFSSSFGVLIGYIATAQMIRLLTWEWSFYLQIFATVPLWIFIAFTPNELLEVNSDDELEEFEASAN